MCDWGDSCLLCDCITWFMHIGKHAHGRSKIIFPAFCSDRAINWLLETGWTTLSVEGWCKGSNFYLHFVLHDWWMFWSCTSVPIQLEDSFSLLRSDITLLLTSMWYNSSLNFDLIWFYAFVHLTFVIFSLGTFDTILADYLIGAVDGFSPYYQDVIVDK